MLLFFRLLIFTTALHCHAYHFGMGIFDITGPAADVNMMGYAKITQTVSGIHLRLYSRAYIIQENRQTRPILFINLDLGMTSQLLKTEVVNRLKSEFGDAFDETNVLLSSTHTHSGPGGYFQYFLYDITSLGFVRHNFEVMITGIVQSVRMAWENRVDGKILIARGILTNASINRSPASYEMNPADERDRYSANVDQEMTLLKFVHSNGTAIGMINWFPVHAVSMNNTNTLISSDNKGLAAILFEKRMNSNGRLLGKGPFVAAFAQANEGDVSPNIAGPRCIDTGLPCESVHTTCEGRAEKCIAFGPGRDMFESTRIIAQRQMNKAWELFDAATEELTGPISFIHQYVDMTAIPVSYKHFQGTTCKPAMGYSFAAGTMDGPGDFDFTQGSKSGTPFWNFIRDLLKEPSKELSDCHSPKPILLATGELNLPVPWQPHEVETQILRVGNLLIVALPGEFTTMSGRRVREAVQEVVRHRKKQRNKASNPFYVALAGLSNTYTSYIATPEEYQLQRYEGASTIYGPLTLPAYVNQFRKLADALVQPQSIVHAEFVSACPRNDVRQNDTFLTVEYFDETSCEWSVRFTDSDWETKFIWTRNGAINFLLGESTAIIEWQLTSLDGICVPGKYRIRHFGKAKPLFSSKLQSFEGSTKAFRITCGK
ncbi:Neutral ceramidase C [Fasciola hepatica]|uniref:Neutral ceramidase n=1 Tax=Fasciola hepatica TaxID=6192 RepID=A0A4E0RY16_FASHE|nr:Neutral ceramidase C [Fasciola hepatica]